MSNSYHINDLETLLKPCFGEDKTIVSYTAVPLTSAGDNFGSLMLSLTVEVENKLTRAVEKVNLVAKMLPRNELIQEIFNVNVTFRKEVAMYTTIASELKSFITEYRFEGSMDYLAKYYSSRISLDPNAKVVDSDAVLILENLKFAGYVTVDGNKGFDLDTAKLILKDLATFHAVPLAYKLKKPKEFQKMFMPYLGPGLDSVKDNEQFGEVSLDYLINMSTSANERCAELKEKLLEIRNSPNLLIFESHCTFDDPYGTICHLDLWINNILVKFENGKPIKQTFVDFQVTCYANVARDVLFFLFTSVTFEILKEHFEELLRTYDSIFYDILKRFGCDTTHYSFDRFKKELAKAAKSTELVHSMRWLQIILAEKGTIPSIEDMSSEFTLGNSTDVLKKRIVDVILFFDELNWL